MGSPFCNGKPGQKWQNIPINHDTLTIYYVILSYNDLFHDLYIFAPLLSSVLYWFSLRPHNPHRHLESRTELGDGLLYSRGRSPSRRSKGNKTPAPQNFALPTYVLLSLLWCVCVICLIVKIEPNMLFCCHMSCCLTSRGTMDWLSQNDSKQSIIYNQAHSKRQNSSQSTPSIKSTDTRGSQSIKSMNSSHIPTVQNLRNPKKKWKQKVTLFWHSHVFL